MISPLRNNISFEALQLNSWPNTKQLRQLHNYTADPGIGRAGYDISNRGDGKYDIITINDTSVEGKEATEKKFIEIQRKMGIIATKIPD